MMRPEYKVMGDRIVSVYTRALVLDQGGHSHRAQHGGIVYRRCGSVLGSEAVWLVIQFHLLTE